MKHYGYRFDFHLHRKWLLVSFGGASLATFFLAVGSFLSFTEFVTTIPIYSLILLIIYGLIVCGAHLAIFEMYLFLLVNSRIRFQQLNRFLKFVNYTYI